MMKNTIALNKTKSFLTALFRYVIVFGIAFYIVYPLIVKFLYMFMDKADIYDITVIMIPKHLSLDNLKMVLKHMNYFESLFNTLLFSLLFSLLQTVACLFVGYGFARFEFRF